VILQGRVPTPPRISVVLPVRNGAQFVREAVESVLTQTFRDLELIVLDDGSTDETPGIIRSFADPRVVLVSGAPRGLVAVLNEGFDRARGEFIARMDADDVSLPERLERQVLFFERNPDIGIAGCAVMRMDEAGCDQGVQSVPEGDLGIRWTGLLTTPFAHPTILLRRDLVERHAFRYDERRPTVEDYDLWMRLLAVTRGGNLPEPLLRYRVHPGSVTIERRTSQLAAHDAVASEAIRNTLPGARVLPEQVALLRRVFVSRGPVEPEPGGPERIRASTLFVSLLEEFLRCRGEDNPEAASRLASEQASRIARVAFRPPLGPGWKALLERLLNLDPGLPWALLAALPRAVARRKPGEGE